MILVIGSNSRLLSEYLSRLDNTSYCGVDLSLGNHTSLVIPQELQSIDKIIDFVSRDCLPITGIIFCARQRFDDVDRETILHRDFDFLVKFYHSLLDNMVSNDCFSGSAKLFFINSTNSRLISQQNFSYHASCALLDIFSKHLSFGFKSGAVSFGVCNFQIGLTKIPDGQLELAGIGFENAFGQGSVCNPKMLADLLTANFADSDFVSGYREIRLGVDHPADPFYSASLTR